MRDFENDLGETVYKNYLNVSVAPAAAIEFQHFKDTIIEKINTTAVNQTNNMAT